MLFRSRFGITLVGSIKHADAILLTGAVNTKIVTMMKEVYAQALKPCVVIAIGSCSCGQGIFKNGPNTPKAADSIIPIDIYVPGCPPKPEAMIAGVMKLVNKLRGKK